MEYEDWRAVALAISLVLFVLLVRRLGNAVQSRLRGRRAHINQSRQHFVKAATLIAQAKNSKAKANETRSMVTTALQEAELAIQADSSDAAVYIVKSLALQHLGKTAAAIKALDTALSDTLSKSLSNEERADTLAKRAELFLGQAKGKRDTLIDDALADLKESVKLSSKNPRVFCCWAPVMRETVPLSTLKLLLNKLFC